LMSWKSNPLLLIMILDFIFTNICIDIEPNACPDCK